MVIYSKDEDFPTLYFVAELFLMCLHFVYPVGQWISCWIQVFGKSTTGERSTNKEGTMQERLSGIP